MKHEKVVDWVESLSVEQLQQALTNTVEYMIDTDDIQFPEEALAPYWESCGEPLVFGQQVWEDE